MRFLQGFAVATVMRDAEVKISDDGDPYVEVHVRFDEHKGKGDRPYSQRIAFRSFEERDVQKCPAIREGMLIGFEGTVDAVVVQHHGRVFANPRVTGRILQLGEVGT